MVGRVFVVAASPKARTAGNLPKAPSCHVPGTLTCQVLAGILGYTMLDTTPPWMSCRGDLVLSKTGWMETTMTICSIIVVLDDYLVDKELSTE